RRHTRFSRDWSSDVCSSDLLYDWREMTTYIRRPPYWEGKMAAMNKLKGMRPLAVLGDNITTDHLSPSNAILGDSAAGEYLDTMRSEERRVGKECTARRSRDE